MKRSAALLICGALSLLLLGCSSQPPASPSGRTTGPATATDSDAGFTLTLSIAERVVGAGEEIAAEATLAYEGPERMILSGSGSGPVFFTVTRIEDGLTSGPAVMTDDCALHELEPGATLSYPFAKSGAWSPEDPHAEFLRSYLDDPLLRLPAGTWRIEARTVASLGEGCSGEPLGLTAAVDVVVETGPGDLE